MAGSLEIATARAVGCGALRLRPGGAARRRVLSIAVLAGMMCSCLPGGPLAWGQDDWDAVKDPANPPAARVFAAPQFHLPDFDRWVYGGKTSAQVKQMLMSRFTSQLESVERDCQLSEVQRRKLELAARGDVRRFFRQADEVRAKFGEVRNDQQMLGKIMQEIQPLQAKIKSSFFDQNSLLHKVLKGTLDDEQSHEYEQQQRERRRFQYEAKIELALAMLETGVPLRERQRQRFVKLLLDQTEPPNKFGQQACYVVFYQAGTLEEEKLKAIFDDAQWRAIKQLLFRAKGLEAHLKSNGFIP